MKVVVGIWFIGFGIYMIVRQREFAEHVRTAEPRRTLIGWVDSTAYGRWAIRTEPIRYRVMGFVFIVAGAAIAADLI